MSIIMLVSSIAVFLAGSILISFSAYMHRLELVRELTSLAGVIGNNCEVILEFKLNEDAQEVLSTLSARESIVFAGIYDLNNEIISTYRHHVSGDILQPPDTQGDSHVFANGNLYVFHPVRVNKAVVGIIYLQDDMRNVYADIKRDTFILIFVMLLALAAAYIISGRLMKVISGPILKLAEMAGNISEKNDYSIRANKENKDEIGKLIDSFNDMLSQIQHRDNALKESEKRYRSLQDNVPIAIFRTSADGRFISVNPDLVQLLGYKSKEELLGISIADIYVDAHRRQALLEMMQAQRSVKNFELQVRQKNGNIRWVSASIKAISLKGEDEFYMDGSAEDITERKRAEEALKKKTHDLGERIKELNCLIGVSKLIEKPGISLEKIYQGTIDLIPPSWQYPEITCSRIILDGKEYKTKIFKETIWKQSSEILKYGQRVGVLEVYYLEEKPEIDEGVFLKEERTLINAITERLGHIIEHKHTEKEKIRLEAQLNHTQKMETIGTLAGGIAHDFNNILYPIVGYTEMLLEDAPEDSPLRDSLDEIFTGTMRARDLVKQILTFSRQDSSEIKLIKIQPVIKEALKLIRSTISTSIEIKQDIRNDCGIIKADPTQIHQIIMNLATNAYHAMEDTGGELKVSLKEIELGEFDVLNPDMIPGTYACLTVADTGTGMDNSVTEKIFDPFYTTKETGKGTGMGLSVVHGIVKNSGGSIHVYSEPGKGSEFHVYLPVVKSKSEQQKVQTTEVIQGGTEQILLVDDEDAIIRMEQQMLERLGYQVDSRSSSTEALEAFRADPKKFDLVITDMAMPNMTGDKLAAELIKIQPDVPILLCTGFSEKIPEEEALSMGIKGFLMKPIVRADLSSKIRKVLDDK